MAHENSQLRTQLSTLKQNQSNAQKAPVGSVTAHGGNEIAAEDDFMRGSIQFRSDKPWQLT
jgi:hypothetical protein